MPSFNGQLKSNEIGFHTVGKHFFFLALTFVKYFLEKLLKLQYSIQFWASHCTNRQSDETLQFKVIMPDEAPSAPMLDMMELPSTEMDKCSKKDKSPTMNGKQITALIHSGT